MQVITIAFFELLRVKDLATAMAIKTGGCPRCGGVLDVSNYPRKPRGLEEGAEQIHPRYSFCCRCCRRRCTPESVRFLGRKVYVALVVILAMDTEWLKTAAIKICWQTRHRWKLYWTKVLGVSSWFWRKAKGLLDPIFIRTNTPIDILKRFEKDKETGEIAYTNVLKFFSPLSGRAPPVLDGIS